MPFLRRAVSVVVAATVAAATLSGQSAQSSQGVSYSDLPEAEAFAEGIGIAGAQVTGQTELENAISSGIINVYPGLPPRGGPAVSWINPDGTATIVFNQFNEPTVDMIFWEILHEYCHIVPGGDSWPPPPGDPSTPPSETAKQKQACDEHKVHCEVLEIMQYRYEEHGIMPFCKDLSKIVTDASWEGLWCEHGSGASGPPAPEPCPGETYSTMPCREGD